jgi:maltooligosyltrehalose synthase
LSEIPEEWKRVVEEWMDFNLKFKKEAVVGPRKIHVPERNEEYLLYQTLIGKLYFLANSQFFRNMAYRSNFRHSRARRASYQLYDES